MKAKYTNPKTEKDIFDKAAMFYAAAIGMVLYDKHGADKEEIHSVIKNINYYVDSFRKGYLSLDDAIKTLDEEADVRII